MDRQIRLARKRAKPVKEPETPAQTAARELVEACENCDEAAAHLIQLLAQRQSAYQTAYFHNVLPNEQLTRNHLGTERIKDALNRGGLGKFIDWPPPSDVTKTFEQLATGVLQDYASGWDEDRAAAHMGKIKPRRQHLDI